jgi:cobalt-zinc-cadmium efflux system membrane fusion protein
MTGNQRAWFVLGTVTIIGGACGFAWWANKAHLPPPKAKPSDTSVASANKTTEEEMGRIVLSEASEKHLGVRTARLELKNVRQQRVYGGEVTVPAGLTVLVAAPLSGTLRAPEGGVPLAGSHVEKEQAVFLLSPLLSPEASTTFATSRAEAEGLVHNARTQLEAMKLALSRAQRLFGVEAGSKRGVEEAQAQHDTAMRALEAAESRLTILTKAVGDAATGRASPIPIPSPETGVLRNVSALADQNVPSGAALFEVIDLTRVWVRVPVFVGDLDAIAINEVASVGGLNARHDDNTWPAKPVAAPPSANALAATVDLFYALDNADSRFTPGQRVGVKLSLRGDDDALTVPSGAVVYDINGNTWVFRKLAANSYKRERVALRFVDRGAAVLASGPAVDSEIVVEGAQELFGVETGFSK